MAKQHVSPIERHLDKAILAVAGLVLLWVVFSYLIMSPNQAEYGGEALGPGELYSRMESEARSKLMELQNTGPEEEVVEDTQGPIDDPSKKRSPIDTDPKLKPTFATAFVPPGITVPDIEETLSGDVILASILPLRKPLLTQGKALVDLPAPQPTRVGAPEGAADRDQATTAFPPERRWVTLWTFLNRKAQRDLFEKAGYDFARQKIMVARVDLERQEMRPDGTWGEPQLVQPYDPAPIIGFKRELSVLNTGGTASVSEADLRHIEEIRRLIEEREGQHMVLRPEFQAFLQTADWRWQPPQELTGDKNLVWQKYGVRLYDLTDDALKNYAKPVNTGAATGRTYYLDALKQAKEFLEKKEYLKAYEELNKFEGATDAGNYARQADELRAKHQQDFQRAIQQHEQDLARQATALEVYYGDDVDPVWINDLAVEPGKRYRYRVRPVLLNSYAGLPAFLKNAQDGGKVLLEGDWSAWSADILVQPDTYMFFTGADEQLRSATVYLHQWSAGLWQNTNGTFGIGDRIKAERGNVSYEYDGVVADLEFGRAFSKRDERSGTVSYQETQTPALTLVSAVGRVEERLAEQDNTERGRLRDQLKREETIERILKSDTGDALLVQPPEDMRLDGFAPERGGFGGPGFGGPALGGPGGPRERAPRMRSPRERRPTRGGPGPPRGEAPPS